MNIIEQINEAFQFEYTLKEDLVQRHLPYVHRFYVEQIEEMQEDNEKTDRHSELQSEQKYFMENTLNGVNKILNGCDAHDYKALKSIKKEDLIEIIRNINSEMTECMADL